MNATTEHKGTAEKVGEKIADKAEKATSRVRQELHHVTEHGLDVKKVLTEAKSLGSTLESQFKTRPYAVLAATAGASFLVGSIFGSRLGRFALAVGAGYAATRLLDRTDIQAVAKDITS